MPPPTPRRALPALLAAGLLSACATTGPRTAEPAPTPEPPHHPALAPFAHLAGVWRAPAGRGFIEEAWLPPAGDNALGVLRWVSDDGPVRMLELFTLTPEGPGPDAPVRLRLRHYDAAMTPWAPEAGGPIELIADAPDPARLSFTPALNPGDLAGMVYDLSEPGRLTVTLRFEGGREPVVIRFERAAQAAWP